jgi:hypothetical protein
MARMKWPQFSLAFIFLEVFWIAAALGVLKLGSSLLEQTQNHSIDPAFASLIMLLTEMCLFLCMGAAIGGLFRRMTLGFALAAALCCAYVAFVWIALILFGL